jgi:hypothetical protein
MFRLSLILLLPFLIFLGSCRAILPDSVNKDLVCPPPPTQDCYPQRFIGRGTDTSSQGKSRFMRITQVEGLNNPLIDEWNITFLNTNEGWSTVSASGRQQLRKISLNDPDLLSAQQPMEQEEPGALGFITRSKGLILGSMLRADNYPGDADIVRLRISDKSIYTTPFPQISRLLHWDAQPALSPDGRFLFFTSDRDQQIQGTDIYVSMRINDSTWTEPKHCGRNVNSRCDEISPFVALDGKTLLFSSSGHANVGGYDLFSSIFDSELLAKGILAGDSVQIESAFSRAGNLGVPINTPDDEMFPSSPVSTYDTLLYYTSNQMKPGLENAFDLYVLHPGYNPDSLIKLAQAQIPIGTRQKAARIDPRELIMVEGRVIDEKSRKPVKNAEVTSSTYPERELIDQQLTDTSGRYKIKVATDRNVEISAESEKQFFDSYIGRFSKSDSNALISMPIVLPERISLRINFPTDEFKNPYEFVLDSNGNQTTLRWTEALLQVARNLIKYQKRIGKLVLTGHTDEVGTDAYNLGLGKRRVEFIAAQLRSAGVPAEMLETRSEGERTPLPRRQGEETEQFYKRCRRVDLYKEIAGETIESKQPLADPEPANSSKEKE